MKQTAYILTGVWVLIVMVAVGYLVNREKPQKQVTTQVVSTNIEAEKISQLEKRLTELEQKLESLNKKVLMDKFYSLNKRTYYLNNKSIIFNACCESVDKVGYDLLVQSPLGSDKFDDFGTTSYISFDLNEKIEEVKVTPIVSVPENPIYKVMIVTDRRKTEGVVFPDGNYGNYVLYERLFDIKDGSGYTVTITPLGTGFKIKATKNTAGKPNVEGEYLLERKGEGYIRKIIRDINTGTSNLPN